MRLLSIDGAIWSMDRGFGTIDICGLASELFPRQRPCWIVFIANSMQSVGGITHGRHLVIFRDLTGGPYGTIRP